MTRSPYPRSRRHLRLAGASAAAIVWSLAGAAQALPTGGVVVGTSGSDVGAAANIGPGGTGVLTIDQFDERIVIDWSSFNIDSGETVNFNQGGAHWIAFNRVDPAAFSTINGDLNATGGVWLFSPGGLLFGPNAQVNVASFVGSTARLLDSDMVAALSTDTITLSPLADRNGATLEVQAGAGITATDGYVVLLGETIVQNGDVVSNNDAVWFGVAEGGQVQIATNPDGSTLVDGTVSAVSGRGRPSLTHGGLSQAGSWLGIATPGAVEAGFETVINLGGTVRANGVRYGTTEGVVILTGADGVVDETAGDVVIDAANGFIDADYDIYIVGGSVILGGLQSDHSQIDVLADSLIQIVDLWGTPYSDISLETTGADSLVQVDASVYAASVRIESAGDILVGADGEIDTRNYHPFPQPGTSIELVAAGDLTLAAGSEVDAYADVLLQTTGQDSVLSASGFVRGRNVYMDGSADVDLFGNVDGAGLLDIDSNGSVDIDGHLFSGSIDINADDDVILGANAYLYAVGQQGSEIDISAGDYLTVAAGASLFSDQVRLETRNAGGALSVAGDIYGPYGVYLAGADDITVTGTITAGDGVIEILGRYGDSYTDGRILIGGDLTAAYGVQIRNYNTGDLVIGSGAVVSTYYSVGCQYCLSDGGSALYGADGDIYIYGAGSVITEAGSVIDATMGYGVDAGLVTIVSAGADGGHAAIDLSGAIYGTDVVLETAVGSVRLDGLIDATEQVYIDSALNVSTGAGSVIDGEHDGPSADITIYAGNDITLDGAIEGDDIHVLSTGLAVAGEPSQITIGGEIDSYGYIEIEAWNGDIAISGNVYGGYAVDIDASGDLHLTTTAYVWGGYGEGDAGVSLSGGDNLILDSGSFVGSAFDVELLTYEAGGLLSAGGQVVGDNISIHGAANVHIGGDLVADLRIDVVSDLGDGVADADIVIAGSLEAPGGISIANLNNGDVVLESTAVLLTYYDSGACYTGCQGVEQRVDQGGATALYGLDGDIYIYSAGSVITAAGSLIDATGGAGADAGLVTIVSAGADGAYAAIDLAGDIISTETVLETTAGSVRLRDGTIYFSELLNIDSALHVTQDGPSVISATAAFAPVYIDAAGSISIGGSIENGYTVLIESSGVGVPGGSLIEISGSIYASDYIDIRNAYGDIRLTGTAELYAGAPVEFGDPSIYLRADGEVSTAAGSLIHTNPAYDGEVEIRSTAVSGTGIDLAGDIDTGSVHLNTVFGQADVQITSGAISAQDSVFIESNGGVNITGGAITAGDLVQVRANSDILLAGEIDATYVLASIYGGEGGGVDGSVIRVEGDISAGQTIEIYNELGDVEIGSTGRLYGNLDGAVLASPAIEITGEQIITESGSLMRVGPLAGLPAGSIELHADGDDGAVAALDISGDIDTESLVLDAGTGGMHVRDGQIDVYNIFYGQFDGAFVVDEPAVINSDTWISVIADGGVIMNGAMNSSGTVTLYSPTAYDVSVGGYVQANEGIVLRSLYGDVSLTAGGQLYADADGLYGLSEDITIAAGGSVVTAAGTVIQTGADGAPSGEVFIQANLANSGAFGIDLSGDITAQDLTLVAPGSSIRLRDGDIFVVSSLEIASVGAFLMDGPATITSEDDVAISAVDGLTVAGTVTSGADISLLKTGANGGVTVNGALTADDDISIVNSGGGDIVFGGPTILADADGDSPGADVYISSENAVVAPGGGSIRVGLAGAPTGDVTIQAGGGDVGGVNAIDLAIDIEAINLTLDAAAGSIELADGDILLDGSLVASAAVDFLMGELAIVDAGGDVTIDAARVLTVDGDIEAGGGANLLLNGPASQNISIGGAIDADGGIDIENAGPGDVLVDGALIAGGGGVIVGPDALAVPGGIEISSGGSVITGAGSLLQSSDFVSITADGLDAGGYSAVDLSGDITTGALELTATAGSIRLRDGLITVSEPLLIDSGLDFVMDAPAGIVAGGDVDIAAARLLTVDGAVASEGDVGLTLTGPSAQALSIGGTIAAAGDINVAGGADVLVDGALTAGGGVDIVAGGSVVTGADSLLQGGTLVAIGADGAGDAIDLSGDITAATLSLEAPAGSIRLRDGTITVQNNLVIGSGLDFAMESPALIDAAAGVEISAGRDLTVDGTIDAGSHVTLLVAGPDAGDLSIGGLVTTTAGLLVYNHGDGDILIDGDLYADTDGVDTGYGDNMVIDSGGRIVTGDDSVIRVGGEGVTGFVTLYSYGYDGEGAAAIELSGDIEAESVTLEAYNGSVHLRSGASVEADEDVQIVAYQYFAIEEGASIWGARDRENPDGPGAWPVLPGTPPGVLIAAADVEIDGHIRSGHEGDPATIVISALDPHGPVTVGGEDTPLGQAFTLSNDEFQNLEASRIVIAAGLGEPFGQGYDLHLADLDLDPILVNEVWFGTSENLLVEGVLAPLAGGEVDINLGFTILVQDFDLDAAFTTALQDGQTLVNFIPDNIYITGSLGTVDNPFGVVTLIAQGDVLMGSQAFIEAAANDPEFDAFEQSEDFEPEEGHVFVAADGLRVAAMGRVLQQDTAEGTDFGGLVLGLPTQDVQLIFAPDGIEGEMIGGGSGFQADFSAGPTRVELFGVFLDGSGQITGSDAALVDHLLDPDIALGEDYINSCLFGSSSECSQQEQEPPRFEDPAPPVHEGDLPGLGDEAASFFSAFPFTEPDEEEEEEEIQGEPVTGSGNEDLWPVKSSGGQR